MCKVKSSSLCSDAIVFTTDGQTDGQTDRLSTNVLEFRADKMSPRNLGFQINISMRYTRIDKTDIPSMRIHTVGYEFKRNYKN